MPLRGLKSRKNRGNLIVIKAYFYEIKPIHDRLFLIIIRTVSRPLSDPFFMAYKKAETIIRDKAQSLERENLNQTKIDIEKSLPKHDPGFWLSDILKYYGVLYRESATKGYSYLKCWQDANEQIQNVNNSLLNSNADISVLSNDQLLYSTLPQQKFRLRIFCGAGSSVGIFYERPPELPPFWKQSNFRFLY